MVIAIDIIVSHRRVIWALQWPCRLNGESLLCQAPQLNSLLHLNPASVLSSITRIIRVQRPGGRGYRHPDRFFDAMSLLYRWSLQRIRCALSDPFGLSPTPKGFRRQATTMVFRCHHLSHPGYLLRGLLQKDGVRGGCCSKVGEIAGLNDVTEWSGMGAPLDRGDGNGDWD
jgi:hypothetical protein